MSCKSTTCAVLIGLAGGIASADGGALPDLVETSVAFSQQGRTLRVTDAVANRGGRSASATRTAYYVAGKRIGSRRVEPLQPRATARGSKMLTIPSDVPAGSRLLRVCADARARV